ncbi:MAG: nickel pincer cofactor biosynthesis protein LarB [Methylocystaceae bacterium]
MDLRHLLGELAEGSITVDDAYQQLKKMPFENLDFARIDHHRAVRDIFPEVVFCPGKKPEQIAAIMSHLSEMSKVVLATRATEQVAAQVRELVPAINYHSTARIMTLGEIPEHSKGRVAVLSAGTADQAVAEEAAVTLEYMGCEVQRIYDVGVAGVHRLLAEIGNIELARVIIVVAGMEGALASVVGGLTRRPVIAVPTSVGYGANFGGLSALLSMLNTCAPGVGVVNIDNGFGAAALAGAILDSSQGLK